MNKPLFNKQTVSGREVYSAREVHEFLKVKSKFADWIKNRIQDYGFIENEDFVIISKVLEKGRPEIDYAITPTMGKELSMVEKNDQGKIARLYFIEQERLVKEISKPVLSIEEMIIAQAQSAIETKKRVFLLEEKVKEIEAKSITSRADYFAISGYAALINQPIDVKTASELGRKASKLCNTLGYSTGSMPDPRFGTVKLYPKEVLKTIFEEFFCAKI